MIKYTNSFRKIDQIYYFKVARERNIQLITTTHETRLLNHNYLRRDEIWMGDVNEDGSTKLSNFDHKKVRIDKELEKNYLDGIWGGVPAFVQERLTSGTVTPPTVPRSW